MALVAEERFSIKSMFFSEFHHTLGPCLLYQVPEDSDEEKIPKEVFDAISVYIIPKPEVQGTVVTVNALGYKIVGYPVAIHDKKYLRNYLMFNLCFVCRSKARTVQFEPIVKKLAEYLVTLEVEQEFLFDENKKKQLPELMKKIYQARPSIDSPKNGNLATESLFRCDLLPGVLEEEIIMLK
jgi:hypothetical protein